jgi:hypothetical protein
MSKVLIHIGYPKTGSVTLRDWFSRHPQLLYTRGGIGGFKSVYEICQLASADTERIVEYYVTSSEGLSLPDQEVGTEPISYGYRGYQPDNQNLKSHQAKVCRSLHSLFPDGRILIVTRGVKGRVRSIYSQYVKVGGIAHPLRRFKQLPSSEYGADVNYLVQLYREAFGAEQVLVLPYELMRDEPPTFFAVLEKCLGLNHYEIEIGHLNPSFSPQELYWYPILSNLVSAVAWRLGKRRFAQIYRRYVSLTRRNGLRRLVRILDRLKPGKMITEDDFPWDEILPHFRSYATVVQNDPLYAPYANEYLWNN